MLTLVLLKVICWLALMLALTLQFVLLRRNFKLYMKQVRQSVNCCRRWFGHQRYLKQFIARTQDWYSEKLEKKMAISQLVLDTYDTYVFSRNSRHQHNHWIRCLCWYWRLHPGQSRLLSDYACFRVEKNNDQITPASLRLFAFSM